MELTREERQAKLATLAACEGQEDVEGLLRQASFDSVCPAICVQPGCDYTTGMEPDQDRGHCERCGGQTVQSALVLAGLI